MSARQVLSASTLAALIFANQVWLDYTYAGLRISWWQALAISSADWYLWAALAPAIVWLGTRWPFAEGRRLSSFLVHVPGSALVAAVKVSIDRAVVSSVILSGRAPATSLKLFMAVLTYWAILGAAAALRQARARRTRDLQAARLEAELARAQLDMLRVRLQPHFLFNTLNSISALMREDVEGADLMMTRLADLLRLTLRRADSASVTLQEEMEFTTLYLAIQEARLGDRLTVHTDMRADALPIEIPNQLLQPLVENAFRHGAAARPGPVRIEIRAGFPDESLVIEVEDNGPGPVPGWRPGVGLTTTRARIERMYGAAASLTLERGLLGGALARVTLPVQPDRR